ncbi:UNVERIFIED_CONTAM: EmrB/QacA subfamily drug resistance transporter [Brevibacillus sp. OAP136]
MKDPRRKVLIALLVSTFLTAIESTVVSTAMPKIVRDLGESQYLSWIFSIYLLTMAVTTPIYGKLADLFGRKRVFMVGTGIFLVGSLLCGLSGSMFQLMIFRAVQGLGAGAVQPITMTILGDIFNQQERAKVMGLVSSMWGMAGIVGPLVGGFFVDYVSWHWIFYMNIPIGLASILLLAKFFSEKIVPKKINVDYLGASLFTISVSLFLYLLLAGGEGKQSAWDGNSLILLVISIAVFIGFLFVERRVPEPMLPMSLYKSKLNVFSQAVGFTQSILLIGAGAYLPLWIQDIHGHSATYAGFALLPESIGWLIAASFGGRLMLKRGYKLVSMIGAVFLIIAGIWLATVTPETPEWVIPAVIFVMGLGFGASFTAMTIAVQSSVSWQQRGVATGTLQFMRTMGQTVGVAILGVALNVFVSKGSEGALANGLMNVFMWMLIISVIGFALSLLLPKPAKQPEGEN